MPGTASTSSRLNDDELHATAVLRRFIREYVETFTTRRPLRNRQLLERAFENAHPKLRRRASAVDVEKLVERRQQLERRYSASAPVVQEPLIVRKSSVVYTQQYHDDERVDHENERLGDFKSGVSSDSGEPQDEQQHVTFELVVRNLHQQLEKIRDQNATKDCRIAELETLVARLTTENRQLRHAMHASKNSDTTHITIHTNGNQSLTTESEVTRK